MTRCLYSWSNCWESVSDNHSSWFHQTKPSHLFRSVGANLNSLRRVISSWELDQHFLAWHILFDLYLRKLSEMQWRQRRKEGKDHCFRMSSYRLAVRHCHHDWGRGSSPTVYIYQGEQGPKYASNGYADTEWLIQLLLIIWGRKGRTCEGMRRQHAAAARSQRHKADAGSKVGKKRQEGGIKELKA